MQYEATFPKPKQKVTEEKEPEKPKFGFMGSNASKKNDKKDDEAFTTSKLQPLKKLAHPTEVNRARYNPFIPTQVATKVTDGSILLFDLEQGIRLDTRLIGHTTEGYGLSWSPVERGLLGSVADDGLACFWNTGNCTQGDNEPMFKLKTDTILEDLAFSAKDPNVCVIVGDDKKIRILDLRSRQVQMEIVGHEKEVNCVTYSPHDPYLFATGSSDENGKLWDVRSMKTELHILESHTDEIWGIQWNPTFDNVLATFGNDKKVMVWDLNRIGFEQSYEEANDGPPELLFVHSGHTSKISDMSWNPTAEFPWLIASVASDNIIQMWQVARNIRELGLEDDDFNKPVPEHELE